jgi:mono/diheme cytochrome c family protein
MRRKLLKALALVCGTLLLGLTGLTLRARWILDSSYQHVAAPRIAADRSEGAIARGEMLFQSLCMECHGGPDGRASGKHLAEVPAFFGKFYAANLADETQGVHTLSDAQLARTLRTGVLPSGRFSFLMSTFKGLGDADIAAILGYLRSKPPALTPGGKAQPPSEPTLAAELLLTLAGMSVDVDGGKLKIPVPQRAATVEYGRYMAQAMDCVGCHTDSMASNAEKMLEMGAFAGGVEMTDPTGTPIWSKNITFDAATGIGRFSLDDFDRVLRQGITPDGTLVRKPMLLFSRFERVEVEALYRFLQTMPQVHRPNTPGGHPARKARPEDSAKDLFVNVGCVACHGPGAPYQDEIQAAAGKSDEDVAAWILEPQATKPGSPMPSFRHTLDQTQATELAKYVKELARASGG